jgi:hypothetical protein
MNCPHEIAPILIQIIQDGILRTRSRGWAGDAPRCAIEADHIHNLPALLEGYSPDLLRFYWEVERPTFIRQSEGVDLRNFEILWQELGRYVPHASAATSEAVVPR